MNENNFDPSSNAAFSQASVQSEPFTSASKGGQFDSDFGTSTNAVSQIFKGGGFGSQNKSRLILIGVVAVAVLGFAFWYFAEPMDGDASSESAEEASSADDAAADEGSEEAGAAKAGETAQEAAKGTTAAPAAQTAAPAAPMTEGATGSITLVAPANGANQPYDETQGPAEFKWEGAADQIIFARSSSMQPVVRIGNLNGASSYSFENPYPGTWYWQVKNSAGMSEVRSFKISAPPRRSFPVSQPTAGGSLAGNGGVVSWQAGEKIARYAVELAPAGSSFANAAYRFGTSGTSVALQGVPAGVYDMRVGAFSEVAGRWEWQTIEKVNVQ